MSVKITLIIYGPKLTLISVIYKLKYMFNNIYMLKFIYCLNVSNTTRISLCAKKSNKKMKVSPVSLT